MMISTTAGAAEHGLTQQMTRISNDKVNTIDTIMRTVDLFEIEVQKWQKVESDRVQRFKHKDDIEFV